MTKQLKRVKSRNWVAVDLLTNGLYKSKKEESKKRNKRKIKHPKKELSFD